MLCAVAHGAQALLVPGGLAGCAPVDDVPVRGRHDRHLVDGEVLVEHVERRRGAATAGDGDGGSGLVAKRRAAREEGAVEHALDAARGVRVVDGRAKDEGVGSLGLLDKLVDDVVHHAVTAQFGAPAAVQAVVDGLGAKPHRLGLQPLRLECAGDLGQRRGGVALPARASVDEKNLHLESHPKEKSLRLPCYSRAAGVGIVFGGRLSPTSAGPTVPGLPVAGACHRHGHANDGGAGGGQHPAQADVRKR